VPLSDVARRAIEVVTKLYPRDVQLLLDRLRTAPEAGMRRPTRSSPLNVALKGKPPLPLMETQLVEAFAAEWLRGEFDIQELADAVEAALAEQTGRPQDPGRHSPYGWRTLAGDQVKPGRLLGPSRN
jgi:hypothetical protein